MTSWSSRVRGLPGAYWWLWTGTLVNRLGDFVGTFLTLYLVVDRDLSPSAASAALVAWGAGSVIGQPLGGGLADVVGRRHTLLLAMTGTALAYLALGAAQTPTSTVVAAFVAGVFIDMYRPAVGAMVADVVDPKDRPRAYALLYWAINLGVGVASVVGGALAARSFWLLFVIDAATAAVFGLLIWFRVPETARPRRATDSRPATLRGYRTALQDARLVLLTVSTWAYGLVLMQGYSTVPVAMGTDGLGPASYGIAIAVNPILIVVAQPLLLGWLTAWTPSHLFAVGAVTTGLGFAMTVVADSVILYALSIAVWTLGEIAINTAAPVAVAALSPAELRGRYQAVWGSSWSLAVLVGPAAGLAVLHHIGETWLWLGCLVLCCAAAGTVTAAARRQHELVKASTI